MSGVNRMVPVFSGFWRSAAQAFYRGQRMDPLALGFLAVFLMVLVRNLSWGLYLSRGWISYLDSPIFNYIGWRILMGDAPYRDIFEMNFPGTYVIHAFWQLFFGRTDSDFRAFDLTWGALAVLAMICFNRKHAAVYGLVGGIYYMLLHISHGAVAMAQRDFLMTPFLLFAACYLRDTLEAPENRRAAFLCGVFTACAFWVKPQGALFGMMAAGAVMVVARQPLKGTAITLAWLAAGAALPLSAMIGWLYYCGGLGQFLKIFFHFTLPVYSELQAFSDYDSKGFRNAMIRQLILCLSAMLLTRASLAERAVMVLGLAYGNVHYYSQKLFYYQMYPLQGFEAMFMAWFLPRMKGVAVLRAIVMLGVVHMLCLYDSQRRLSVYAVDNFQKTLHKYSYAYEESVVADAKYALLHVPEHIRKPYLQQHPKDHIQVFDHVSSNLWNVAYHRKWVMPTRHIYSYPFYAIRNSPYVYHLGEQLVGELLATKPLVIFVGGDSYPHPFGTVWRMIDTNPGWRSVFARYYRLVSYNRYYRVYARRI